ncbi:hypothetical protein [Celeribacter sp.]|uniref:hypothetical protein n=1 Tax=Celeribacter sp. TaxID=1890673 RepID=UPI003A909D6B
MAAQSVMNARQLRRKIKRLDADTPKHKQLEQALQEGVGFGNAWYGSQKEHWLGWLAEYDGPGAYGRLTGQPRDARYIYNHIQCAPMLFWLTEAVEVPNDTLEHAFEAVVSAPHKNASQCAALRKMVPWDDVEARLLMRSRNSILSAARTLVGWQKGN